MNLLQARDEAEHNRRMVEELEDRAKGCTPGARMQLEAYSYSYRDRERMYREIADEIEAKITFRQCEGC